MSLAAIRSEPMPPEPVRWTLPRRAVSKTVNAIVTAPLYERGRGRGGHGGSVLR